ncbi:DNA methyltransferase [Vogesella indigofera]|uniref:DNA methyltransferase n=1 Tax=Vogesella indigofera TaxID=45465 RepID=UPI00234EF328|nr:DNA methyltransferase [Vogesella indigofera]MDC7707264.1 DNA methyltransferase [Vogesella indigofera]
MTKIIIDEKPLVPLSSGMLRVSGDATLSRKPKKTSNKMQLSLSGLETLAAAQVTHQGGKGEPFHDWYPYLEGFSSEFVKFVLAKYMPNAKKVIEPFAGTGTTPVALAAFGIDCGYCEVNPAMRLVVEAKMALGSAAMTRRKKIASRLQSISENLPTLVKAALPDKALQDDYKVNFEGSKFFSDAGMEAVLSLRTVNDEVAKEDKLIGQLFTIAVIAKLVICSMLKRSGDVRYKTEKELQKGIPDLVGEVSDHLLLISRDCLAADHLIASVGLITANARDLVKMESIGADGVITSPPYLNGTNYFRNTKLELWYGRFLSNGITLRSYRDAAITSGINDVGVAQGRNIVHKSVRTLVDKLSENAYDKRIPRMVAGYFEDMRLVLQGLMNSCKPGAPICIDIGDSRYGGVHVPTHEILEALGVDIGLEHIETLHLRNRISKDRSVLSQSLIVFRTKVATTIKPTPPLIDKPFHDVVGGEDFLPDWERFKGELPHQKEPYSKRNWGSSLHSVCSYQAKMKPALAHHLVKTFSHKGDKILDPFSGSGTIPFEACLMGRQGYGLEISLLGTAVSNAKLMRANEQKVRHLIDKLDSWIKTNKASSDTLREAEEIKFNGVLAEYFHPDTYQEVLSAREFFAENQSDSPEWHLVMACMLHVLHGNRPYALSRNSHPITPYAPTGDYIKKSVVEKVRAKVEKSLASQLPDDLSTGRCFQGDICSEWPSELRNIDAIITSPPFYDSTRFYITNWMRFWFCGWARSDYDTRANEFVESLQKKNFDVYRGIFEQFYARLKPGGLAVLHLGLSHKCDMAMELAKQAHGLFKVLDIATESVGHCESHGIRDKGTTTGHQYLILQK